MSVYYNEIDPYAAQWLRNLIAAGHIPAGEVDTRSIVDVKPDDLRGFTACHFFAGLGGWPYALRLAGVPDDFPVWTGSCPCQPFSVAGKRRGFDDDRHLWPVWRDLIAERRPAVVFGEQVASAAQWLAGVRGDLEGVEYAVGAMPIEAASVGAAHKRDRYWFVADAGRPAGQQVARGASGDEEAHGRAGWHPLEPDGHHRLAGDRQGAVADASGERRGGREDAAAGHDDGREAAGRREGAGGSVLRSQVALVDATGERRGEGRPEHEVWRGWDAAAGASGPTLSRHGLDIADRWDGAAWLLGADGKARRVEPGIRLLAHGVPNRVAKLRALGNAIVPQVAAEFIRAAFNAINDVRNVERCETL